MKNVTIVLAVLAFMAVLGGSPQTAALATSNEVQVAKAEKDSTDKAEEKTVIEGSDSKGKYYHTKSCKSCHGPKGEGGEITPISKTTKQWERYFKKGVHLTREGKDGKKIKEMLPKVKDIDEVRLIHIRTFLINHAADSDQPETCG